MNLGDKQRLFPLLFAMLTIYAYENGYEFTDGDGFRDPRVFGPVGFKKGYGHRSSAHKRRLARDINLHINGVWMKETITYKKLGDYWKRLNPINRWGGDFKDPDGGHFSMEHNGIM